MAVTLAKRAFTLDEYHRIARAGIPAESDRVELIRGEIPDLVLSVDEILG